MCRSFKTQHLDWGEGWKKPQHAHWGQGSIQKPSSRCETTVPSQLPIHRNYQSRRRIMIQHLEPKRWCCTKDHDSGAANPLQPVFVLCEFGSITWVLETNNLTKWFHSTACRTRTVVPRWLRPSKSVTDVSEVAQRCPKKRKEKKEKVFLVQAKRPSLSSPCLMLWVCVGVWRAHVGKYAP